MTSMARRCIPLLCLLLCACGTVRSSVVTAPEVVLSTAQFVFIPVTADSKEKNPDADAYNTQLKADAQQAMIAMVRNRGGKWVKAGSGAPSLVVSVHSIYGNRALRAFVGWGAGSAKITVNISLRAADGHVIYATTTDGKLRRGLAGGNVLQVGERTIQKAFLDFDKRF